MNIAREKGIDLSNVKGTGAGGKITKGDVLAIADGVSVSAAVAGGGHASEGPSRPLGEKRTTRKKMSPLRKKIANHLVNAQQDAALLSTFNECDMTRVMETRKRVQEKFVEKNGVKLGFMSIFLKAVVEGLKTVPSINARIEGDEVVQNHFFDIGVAVGTEKGLVVPVIRDVDQKTFAEI